MTTAPSLLIVIALSALLLRTLGFNGLPLFQHRKFLPRVPSTEQRGVNRLVQRILLYDSNSKFNLNPKKLLEEAKRIREEASDLQNLQNSANNNVSAVQDAGREAKVSTVSDFVSTTVLEKGITSIQQLEKDTPKEVKINRAPPSQGSVLVDRIRDNKSRLTQLNKLDGSYSGASTNTSLLYEQLVGSAETVELQSKRISEMLEWDAAVLGSLYGNVGADAEFVFVDVSAQNTEGESTVPPPDTQTLDEAYASISSWWKRWFARSLAKSLMSVTENLIREMEPEAGMNIDKGLLELIVVREMKRIADDFEDLPDEFTTVELDKVFSISAVEGRVVKTYLETVERQKYLKDSEDSAAGVAAGERKYCLQLRRQKRFETSCWRSSAEGEEMFEDGRRMDPDGSSMFGLRDSCTNLFTESEVLKVTINQLQEMARADPTVGADEVSATICETVSFLYNKTMWWYDDLARSDVLRQIFPDVEQDMKSTLRNIQGMLLFVRDPSVPISASENTTTAGQLTNSFFKVVGGLREAFNDGETDEGTDSSAFNTAAERLISEYFDFGSRQSGMAIGRVGAGRFQSEILRDIFSVTSVTMLQGAVIFEGSPATAYRDTELLAAAIEQKYLASGNLSTDVRYTIIQNEKYPSNDGSLQQAALDMMMGSSPAVIVFPSTWNSTVSVAKAAPFPRAWTNLLTTASVIISGAYAVGCYSLLDANKVALSADVPEDLLPLAFVPIALNTAARVAETIAAKMKGVTIDAMLVPATSMFTYGVRTAYLDMPKSRNDIFDIASIGIITLLVSSFVACSVGLGLTADASASALEAFPAVPLPLLRANQVIYQLLSHELPNIAVSAGVAGAAADVVNSMVHLHWLAIVGALTFISATLQLLPYDNSAGSKLSYAVLGREYFYLFNAFLGIVKFFLIIPALFSLTSSMPAAITKYRLLVDYLLSSQISSSNQDTQIAVDNLTPITDTRKIVFGGLCFVEFLSYFPYQEIGDKFQALLSEMSAVVNPGSGLF